MSKKPPWSEVKLRVAWGEVPEFGDELVIVSTGRRYAHQFEFGSSRSSQVKDQTIRDLSR